ncbi:MAG TPA: hypothetical protein VLG47_05095 [Candidatus Saccharimonadales bacterium]|nr:hypothetical protein [Candidatus Saccharimonadales bacterium]
MGTTEDGGFADKMSLEMAATEAGVAAGVTGVLAEAETELAEIREAARLAGTEEALVLAALAESAVHRRVIGALAADSRADYELDAMTDQSQ